MPLLLLLAVIAFIALPYDAQYTIVGVVRDLWLTDAGRAFLAGAVGALFAYLAWSTVLWNAFAWHLRKEEVERADANYQRRKR